MSIFSKIKNAIFGGPAAAAPAPAVNPAGDAIGKAAAKAAQAQTQVSEVDVEAQLDAKPGADKLNWRTSIVDLMKLIGLDASYAERKELAVELGRTNYEGSAEDNIWLHSAVMRELAKNGGRVPASMLD